MGRGFPNTRLITCRSSKEHQTLGKNKCIRLGFVVTRIKNVCSNVRSGNLISPGEPLARCFVAPSKEKKIYKIKLKIKVELKKYIAEVSVMVVQLKLKRIKKNMSEKYHAHASDRSQIFFLK